MWKCSLRGLVPITTHVRCWLLCTSMSKIIVVAYLPAVRWGGEFMTSFAIKLACGTTYPGCLGLSRPAESIDWALFVIQWQHGLDSTLTSSRSRHSWALESTSRNSAQSRAKVVSHTPSFVPFRGLQTEFYSYDLHSLNAMNLVISRPIVQCGALWFLPRHVSM